MLDPASVLRLLIIEDEPDLREAMVSYLCLEDFYAVGVESAEAATFWLQKHPIDIAIVDVGLPDCDGVTWLHQQRQGTLPFGVVMVTAHGESADRLRGRYAGADVYLTKPVDFEELVVVIRNLSARLGHLSSLVRPCWYLDLIGWYLKAPDGQRTKLTGSECRLLRHLAEKPGHPIPRDALIRALGHNPDAYDPRRMEILVRRLRNKVREQLNCHLPLDTVHSVGYAFTADMRFEGPA